MEQGTTTARPTFLTVLCILTWIGCAISLVMNILAYLALSAMGSIASGLGDAAAAAASSSDLSGMDGAMGAAMASANAAVQYAFILLILNIVGVLLCFVGSMQMWKLKKMGFYIYTVGELVPPIIAMVLVGMGGMGSLGIFGLVIPIAFVVLYGLNLKSMK